MADRRRLRRPVQGTLSAGSDIVADALTGLGNRLAWEEALADVEADRRARPTSLIVVDLDGLKLANDSRGHDCGDALLRAVARVVQRATRDCDLVARVGGDELGVLMRDADEDACRLAVDRLADAIRSHPRVEGLRLSAAIGHATCAPDECPAEARRLADARMYAEKQSARSSTSSRRLAAPA